MTVTNLASNAFFMAPFEHMSHLDLHTLTSVIIKAKSERDIVVILESLPSVRSFYSTFADVGKKINDLGEKKRLICLKVIAIGQEDVLKQYDFSKENSEISAFFDAMQCVEDFYSAIGGIVGYQRLALDLMSSSAEPEPSLELMQPESIDIRKEKAGLFFALEGLKHLNEFAMLYPVGGAADRFGLVDEKTKKPLPLAKLIFLRKTLLEHLVSDVIAKEYLYFKCFNKAALVPMGLMTSDEKSNHEHIVSMLEDKKYFGRPKELFHLFKQPRVPLFDLDGNWLCDDLGLILKPGGHGMIWQLAQDLGFFDSVKKQKKKNILVRQINNPASSIDYGLLAFIGAGIKEKKHFGFASCPRVIGSKEGMDVVKVLAEDKKAPSFTYTLTNIEYTEFKKCGLQDIENSPDSGMSAFPSNTNILFARIEALEKVLNKGVFPGPILNFKGGKSARIELMMQNIADSLGDSFDKPLEPEDLSCLNTYLTYNERKKTISVTKNKWSPGEKLDETPAGALFDHLGLMKTLLMRCDIKTPALDKDDYLKNGPSFCFFYHPAIGPFFSVIAQKIHGGVLSEGSFLNLNIAEVDVKNLDLEGALVVQAKNPTGFDGKKHTHLSGKCTLRNVTIRNKGQKRGPPFKAVMQAAIEGEALEIEIEGYGEFIAEDITFTGPQKIEVPSGVCIRAVQDGAYVKLEKSPIKSPTWIWQYHLEQGEISLGKKLIP